MSKDVMPQLMRGGKTLQAGRSVSANVDLPRHAIRKIKTLQRLDFHESQFNALPHNQLVNIARLIKRQAVPHAVFKRHLSGLAQGGRGLEAHWAYLATFSRRNESIIRITVSR